MVNGLDACMNRRKKNQTVAVLTGVRVKLLLSMASMTIRSAVLGPACQIQHG